MKKILFIFLLFTIIASCSKKNSIDNDIPKDLPAWLQQKMREVSNESYKELYTVTEYRIEGLVVFMFRSPMQSCSFCDLFDANGLKLNIYIGTDTKIETVREIWPTKK